MTAISTLPTPKMREEYLYKRYIEIKKENKSNQDLSMTLERYKSLFSDDIKILLKLIE